MLNKKQLMEIGLTDKEAGVYLALLELGPATVSHITRKAKINRTTGYDILEILSGRGLVNILAEGGIKKYAAEDPYKLIANSENKLKQIQSELETTKRLLPELKSIFNKTEKPKVRFYEGKEEMKQAFEDTLTAKETIVGYACAEAILESVPDYPEDYIKRRVAKGVKTKSILPNTPAMEKFVKHDEEHLRKSCLVPSDKLDLEIEIGIYDNKVIIASWKEDLAIIIESEKIAQAQKQIFELAWEAASKYQKTQERSKTK